MEAKKLQPRKANAYGTTASPDCFSRWHNRARECERCGWEASCRNAQAAGAKVRAKKQQADRNRRRREEREAERRERNGIDYDATDAACRPDCFGLWHRKGTKDCEDCGHVEECRKNPVKSCFGFFEPEHFVCDECEQVEDCREKSRPVDVKAPQIDPGEYFGAGMQKAFSICRDLAEAGRRKVTDAAARAARNGVEPKALIGEAFALQRMLEEIEKVAAKEGVKLPAFVPGNGSDR